jgi:predicted DNA-binding protein YlxM (UPF0122 family)
MKRNTDYNIDENASHQDKEIKKQQINNFIKRCKACLDQRRTLMPSKVRHAIQTINYCQKDTIDREH